MLPVQAAQGNNAQEILDAEPAKMSLPSAVIKRLKIFEIEESFTPHQRRYLKERIVKEHASSQLNEKLVISFPNEFSRNFDPFINESRSLFTSLRQFCHRALASVTLIAASYTQKARQQLDQERKTQAKIFLEDGYTTLRLTLEDGDGVKYDAILSGKIEDIIEGNFVFRLGGNNEPFEASHDKEVWYNYLEGFATFQINGPGVGRSQGQPSYASMIMPAKIGLKFLESLTEYYEQRRMRPKGRIELKGFSLGNGILSELLRWHKLNQKNSDYLIYSLNTFSRLSDVPKGFLSQHIKIYWLRNIAEKICSIGNEIFRWAKFDFDALEAAHRLSRLSIPQAIQQPSACDGESLRPVDDGVISADATLLSQVVNSNEMHKKLACPNAFFDSETIGIRNTEMTHCLENWKWSRHLLRHFDEIVEWAQQPSDLTNTGG